MQTDSAPIPAQELARATRAAQGLANAWKATAYVNTSGDSWLVERWPACGKQRTLATVEPRQASATR